MEEYNVHAPAHLFKEALSQKKVRGMAEQKQGEPEVVTTQLVDTEASPGEAARLWWSTSLLKECLHELFEQQAARTPDATALISATERLTYRELNARANRLAHFLRDRGVGADTPVGVCTERSAEMVVALLGVLKAGGGYVPLDPEYPRERISLMLADSGVTLLLTQQRLLAGLPPHAAEVLRLDADWDEVAQSPETNLPGAATPENLAYIIYTSGSTGRPKGVMVTHRALGNHMLWMQRRFPLTFADRVVQKTPFSFDASVWELFAPLLVGARLVMAAPGGHQDPTYLCGFMIEQGITALKIVPSLLERLLDEEGFRQCESLRYVFCGAEAMPLKLAERFFGRTGAELFNLYGPTEAAIDVTFWPCKPGHKRKSIPIGKPIINTQVYVLDERMRLAPMGVSGELYIGGESLARGYWQRPELTAEKFVPNPYGKTPGARLYRTGDMVRWNDERELEYLGRNDAQVKVRGFRIELGEIEAALLERDEVGRAVVLVREEEGRAKQLAAYVAASDGVEPDSRELRGYLQGRLPEYMVPASINVVAEMPLMPNGKVDRKALLALKVEGGARERELEGARNEVEELLAQVWRDVLGVERVGIRDNFFELGGDSILSIQIATKAKQLGLPVRVRQLFQHRTIAELAGAIQQSSVANPTEPTKAERDEAFGELPLTPIQRRFFEHRLPNPHHYNQSVMLEADAAPDPDTLRAVVAKLVAHHTSLLLRFTETEGVWHQSYADSEQHEVVSYVDLSHLAGDEQRRQLEAQAAATQAGLNITQGPLLRAVLFDLGAGRGARLLLAIHHLAIDGVSWRILLEDLQTVFNQAREGRSVELPGRTSSFKRWAEGLRQYAASGRLRAEASYWLDDRRRQVAPLPVDYAEGENRVGSARSVEVALSREETRALLQEVPKAYHTQAQEVLATAVALAVREWVGGTRVLVDMEGHGREDVIEGVDVSRTVGWFTSVYPVLLEVEGSDLASALKSVKEQLRGVPQRGVGYGVLKYLGADEGLRERLRGTREAEVSFNYLGQFDQVLGGSEFSAAPESTGAVQDARGMRPHLLAINGMVVDGQLRMTWGYSEAMHRRESVEYVAGEFIEVLREIVEHCRNEEAGGYTPSDFPLANLDQESLDSLLRDFEAF
jgi:amino acid adenylation domain-containing protein/non-ribosomal peptide synthase protein (TIGR01720 family)